MPRQSLLCMLMVVPGLLASASEPAFTLVEDGKAACSIVVATDASASAKLASEELRTYVKKMSDASLPVTTDATGRDVIIGSLGELDEVPATVRQRLREARSDEAFCIRTENGSIFVVGKAPIGSLCGTYALLEDHLGVRWFHPGELGEEFPQTKTLKLADIDDLQEPHLATRLTALHTASYNFFDSAIWCARNRMQNQARPAFRWFDGCTEERAEFLNQALNAFSSKGGHLIFEQAVPDSLFAEHPDYFTLRDGERKFGDRLQRCLANPKVFELVAEYGLAWCNADKRNVLHICSHDSRDSWCQCEECREMGTVDGTFKITNLYHRFFSRIVDYILERNPDARIDVYFYIDYGVAPDDKSIAYRGRNVRGIYCTCFPHARCYAHRLTDPACALNAKCLSDLRNVLKVCPRIYTYEYMPSANIGYAPVYEVVASDIRDFAAMGVEGFMDITVPVNGTVIPRLLQKSPKAPYLWLARWPSLYVGAKLQWNPELDAKQLMAEAYRKYYGAAASVMSKYHALRLELWNKAPGHSFYGGPTRAGHCLLAPGAEKTLKTYLAQAEELAEGDKKAAERVALDRKLLTMFWEEEAEKLRQIFTAKKQIIPQRTRGPIAIDGKLSEDAWAAAQPATGFLKLNTSQPAVQDSILRVVYDDANLYVGFVAMNDKAWGPVIARMKERDSQEVWGDDHIELEFFPPSSDSHFYHICVNTDGMLYDSVMVGTNIDLSHDAQAEVKVKELADRYVYELRLPLEPMAGDVSPGKVWGMYALRSTKNLQPPDVAETSSLDGNRPHRVHEFRRAVFGRNVMKNGNFAERREKKEGDRGIVGDCFVKHWGVKADECEVLVKPGSPNRLRLRDGLIYSFLDIPPTSSPGTLVGQLRASGRGTLSLWTGTCIRPPSLRSKAFSHAIRTELGSFELTSDPTVFEFARDLAPYEQGYLYIRVSGDAVLSHVSGVYSDK